MRTRRAFFSSKRFLTVHSVPSKLGSSFFQRSGFAKWLWTISMSDGHEARDRRIRAAEHDVFAGGLEVVVRDPERPRRRSSR